MKEFIDSFQVKLSTFSLKIPENESYDGDSRLSLKEVDEAES